MAKQDNTLYWLLGGAAALYLITRNSAAAGAAVGAAKNTSKTKTAADFELGTPANYHTYNNGEQAGEIVLRDGKKTISLYPNKNYGGRERIVYNPDKINWNNMESFTEASKRAGAPFTITNSK